MPLSILPVQPEDQCQSSKENQPNGEIFGTGINRKGIIGHRLHFLSLNAIITSKMKKTAAITAKPMQTTAIPFMMRLTTAVVIVSVCVTADCRSSWCKDCASWSLSSRILRMIVMTWVVESTCLWVIVVVSSRFFVVCVDDESSRLVCWCSLMVSLGVLQLTAPRTSTSKTIDLIPMGNLNVNTCDKI